MDTDANQKIKKTYPQSVHRCHRHRRSLYSWSWPLTRAFRTMPTHPIAWQITLWNQICRVPICSSPFHQNMGRNINQISSRYSWLCVRTILTLSERREAILTGCYGPELCFILARKSLISSHGSLQIKREGEPWHTGSKSFPNYFYIDKETFRMVWLTSWVRNKVGWWERFYASVRDSDELQHSRPYRGASFASLYLTKCQERCFKASWSTFDKERMSHDDF
jgi:hypothetical protein